MLFNLSVTGEAAKKLPDELCAAMPAISGTGPARLRDLIAHHYFALDAEIIWEVATVRVPKLLAQALRARDKTDGGTPGTGSGD